MGLLQILIVTIVTLGVLITVHEWGHFWVARRAGVKVLRFSIGFGKPLFSWHDRQGTEYVVAAIPLGGYVKMLDEREGDVSEGEAGRAFNRQTPPVRIAIAAAGPLANFALAILVYWLVFMGGISGLAPVIGKVEPGSLAERAGLAPKQEILTVNGRETPTWEILRLRLLERLGETGPLLITAKYEDSDLVYESEIYLERWLVGVDEPDPLAGLGITLFLPHVDPVADEIIAGGAAAAAGMRSGDRVLRADGVEIESWEQWVNYVQASPDRTIDLEIDRDGVVVQLRVTPEGREGSGGELIGVVGMSVRPPERPADWIRHYSYGPLEAMSAAVVRTADMTVFTLNAIKKMLTGLLSPKNLSGPITIAKVAGTSAEYGLTAWLSFLALLSVSLAVLNLLPIPVLDGGHICYAFYEWVAGKPASERFQIVANQVGLLFIVGIMIFALYNDVLRL